jgi:hypothetical protein
MKIFKQVSGSYWRLEAQSSLSPMFLVDKHFWRECTGTFKNVQIYINKLDYKLPHYYRFQTVLFTKQFSVKCGF